MAPVRIDQLPEGMENRRKLDIRIWQGICAIHCLFDKGRKQFTSDDVIGEVDQRKGPGYISPVLILLQGRGLIKCITPNQSRGRLYTVEAWKPLDDFFTALVNEDDIFPPLSWQEGLRKNVGTLGDTEIERTHEHGVVETTFEVHTEPEHTNGHRKVGWFRRTFTNAEALERIDKHLLDLLEVWK